MTVLGSTIRNYNCRYSPVPVHKPRIGINGMDRLGRLVLRAAVEAGLQVVAGINRWTKPILIQLNNLISLWEITY